jgi:SAM-dependent methyltransferase
LPGHHPETPEKDFWGSFPAAHRPGLKGKTVLEVGCGYGGRSLECAQNGADVTGIDIFAPSIKIAKDRQKSSRDAAYARVSFIECAIQDLPVAQFDIVISEDAFEHILDVGDVLAHIADRLRPGGRAYVAFGPLYHSPYGDHGWIQKALPYGRLPWSHILLPEKITLNRVSRHYGLPAPDTKKWQFLTLNQYKLREFERFFASCPLDVVHFGPVAHHSVIGKIVDALASLPVLDTYLTDSVACVLQKPSATSSAPSGGKVPLTPRGG